MVGVPHLSGSQKIFNALFILACEQGSIVERLENAYRLALAPLDVQLELPESIHAEFLSVRKELERLYFAPNREAALNAIEWTYSLLMLAFYPLTGEAWRRTGFRFRLQLEA